MNNISNVKYTKKNIIKEIIHFMLIICFGACLAMNYVLFIVPNDFAPAGINGLAVIIQYLCNFSIGFMSLIINIPLCILAFFFINKEFAVKSLVFCLAYSLFYLLFSNIPELQAYIYDAHDVDTVYPVIIAGTISGIVSALSYLLVSSTGGTDIISKFITKKWPHLNFFWIIFLLNAVVAIISCFVYKASDTLIDYKPACLCMLYSLINTIIADVIVRNAKSQVKFFIVTSHPEEVEQSIIKTLKHSATRIVGSGIYSHQEKTILVAVVNKNQINIFEDLLNKIPDTFAFVETVNETLGNFKKIKTTKNIIKK